MLQNLDNYYLSPSLEDSIPKSHPTTPILNQVFSFPLLNSSQDNSSTVLADDLLSRDKALGSSMSMDWASLESAGEVEMSSARRNLAQPPGSTP
ncbi:DNA-binding protein Rfx5 [Caerostris extrusa]|uniref:DNA-binding protein Rfx5 n=1 Tax=Caerostris extrusa TaxID=172846 RepID=A0AAV4NTJ5_CAEEX|nr:DNA-binding protein Rfx5 [Caerostris extrusa]